MANEDDPAKFIHVVRFQAGTPVVRMNAILRSVGEYAGVESVFSALLDDETLRQLTDGVLTRATPADEHVPTSQRRARKKAIA